MKVSFPWSVSIFWRVRAVKIGIISQQNTEDLCMYKTKKKNKYIYILSARIPDDDSLTNTSKGKIQGNACRLLLVRF